MKCEACDNVLSDKEATVKDPDTGEFVDLCERCGDIVAADLGEDTIPESEQEEEAEVSAVYAQFINDGQLEK